MSMTANEQRLIATIDTLLSSLAIHERSQALLIADLATYRRQVEAIVEEINRVAGIHADALSQATATRVQIAEALKALNAERDGESWES